MSTQPKNFSFASSSVLSSQQSSSAQMHLKFKFVPQIPIRQYANVQLFLFYPFASSPNITSMPFIPCTEEVNSGRLYLSYLLPYQELSFLLLLLLRIRSHHNHIHSSSSYVAWSFNATVRREYE